MEGESALFRKGEHPANSVGAGTGGRRKPAMLVPEPVLNKEQQCAECSSYTPTQSQATLALTRQHTNPYFIITTAAPSRPCLRERVCLWTCLRDYGGLLSGTDCAVSLSFCGQQHPSVCGRWLLRWPAGVMRSEGIRKVTVKMQDAVKSGSERAKSTHGVNG